MNLDEDHKVISIVDDYYRDKWSTFVNSMLSNKEKVEILASLFAEDLVDEYARKDIAGRFYDSLDGLARNRPDDALKEARHP
ncbi:Hypothetical protein DEACI_0211 [Acididesulfobacillus acetoxydans]|uniref:Uncharacterized protein n=1 Tax=Acididesulfobacillus acetoxydans TaxID=1561005 RepID=A0A8S0Y1K9_9FIRM|nr:hypothetical protein [Acididesulfobacillus acetoxydans]CAA7599585.1 Hypothetical protein DEACI_0211 [Acididesulfobacillus acetoxydans]CEJ07780.1 Hypothetical protein DEACI_2246 [Acididesulfobacillus acetoxydans]